MTDSKTELLAALDRLVRTRLPPADAPIAAALVAEYFRTVAPMDLTGRSADELLDAALAHWELAQRRSAGEVLVRVANTGDRTVVDVVTDDMAFIVDSVTMAVARRDLDLHLLVHPVVDVARRRNGQLLGIEGLLDARATPHPESFIHLEIDRIGSELGRDELAAEIRAVLSDLRAAIDDEAAMRARALAIATELQDPAATTEHREAAALLDWMAAGNYIFLGYRAYDFVDEPGSTRLVSRPTTGLGLLRQTEATTTDFASLPPEVSARARSTTLLNLTRTNAESTVHRPGTMDYVSVKELDTAGRVTGERRFIGLYTASATAESARRIPVVRAKVAGVMDRSGFSPGSYDYSHLVAILEEYPRDELLEIDVDLLYEHALRMLHLRDRRQVSLFLRRDLYGRYWSCLVFVPRDRHNSDVRERIQAELIRTLHGDRARWSVQITSAINARLQVVVSTPPGTPTEVDHDALERRLGTLVRTWADDLAGDLVTAHGESVGDALFDRWGTAFPAAYRAEVSTAAAVTDVAVLGQLGQDDMAVRLTRVDGDPPERSVLTLYRTGGAVALSALLPILQDLGFSVLDERPYEVPVPDGPIAWIYDMSILAPADVEVDVVTAGPMIEQAFLAAWRGEAESDGLCALILRAGLDWREVAVLRAYRRYQRQIGTAFSHVYVERTLAHHADAARLIVGLFRAAHDPSIAPDDRERAVTAARTAVASRIEAVTSLDEDRILRSFVDLVEATVRTNAFGSATRGTPIALKIDPHRIPDLPSPRPFREVFVYAPRVEGVHLRGGLVARGGIRWSDRRDDFRTEVLGLMKAQTVKNAVIVPVGAKGGFVPTRLPAGADRATIQAEVVACYQAFITALLDVTDNLDDDGRVLPPVGMVRLDGDDPYLVVAADKGTASFSDLANRISLDRDFWLGDAFASGGSHGFDHKEMGITARGAWESARRHFRELGVDLADDQITVVGIGDMSGDVFGNGMLLSPHIRLLAAFDHRHVFVDPNPDPATSLAERQRLFALPQSSWADYDPALISPGGGVFERTRKSIELADEARAALRVDATRLTPPELIRAVLRAPVDLLWNGGIGTYVKAREETHADVGDRANDAVRVDGHELRCRVVVEGGNLGLTQRGRIEFAAAGGRINTDAVDNSAGVDCSDHEVNLKILLDPVVRSGELSPADRNELLLEMTDDVARQVLADNVAQNLALSVARAEAPEMVDVHRRLLGWLEEHAGLNRAVEFLPGDDALIERQLAGGGLTHPELCVVMAYTKIGLTGQVLASDLPDDVALLPELHSYFPLPLQRFSSRFGSHPLRRELIATAVVNRLVNRAGFSVAMRLADETSAPLAEVVRSLLGAWRMFDLDTHWERVMHIPMAADVELTILAELRLLGERGARWLLRNRPSPIDLPAVHAQLAGPIAEVARILPDLLVGADRRARSSTADRMERAGVPESFADQIAGLTLLVTALDIAELAALGGYPLDAVAATYFLLDDRLDLAWLRDRVVSLPRRDRWQALARSALRDDFFDAHRELTDRVQASRPNGSPRARVDGWIERHRVAVDRFRRGIGDLRTIPTPDVVHISVALQELRNLLRQTAG